MSRPVIGIVTKYFKSQDLYGWGCQGVSDPLRYALIKNGGLPFGILPQKDQAGFQEVDEHDETPISDEEAKDLIKLLSLCDGVILQGGENSAYYEEFVAKYCFDNDVPLLGICAGYNTIIRALGGPTKRLEDTSHNRLDLEYCHGCKVVDRDSKYYSIVKTDSLDVNSIHMYVGDNLPDSLTVSAFSDDGQIEVVEAKSKGFYMGVKYHPELLCDVDQKQNDLIAAFVKACR